MAHPARAGLIRDAEVEHTLRELANPVFVAAGQDPQAIKIFVVQSSDINAFVAGGGNIFIHTALLLACEKPEMLLGVIAHETGHISGGHLARGTEQLERASMGAILSYVLGAAAVAAGAGDVGAAAISAGSQAAQRSMLSFSRANESAADEAALSFLDKLGVTGQGMLDMFALLERDQKQHFGVPDPYTLTHPLTGDRIADVRHHVETSPYKERGLDKKFQENYQRMLGKLDGFLRPVTDVLNDYPASDASLKATYARAIAQFRQGDADGALGNMDALLKQYPNDPYLLDTKGQVLFENGRIAPAAEVYRQAVALAPDEPLIRTAYAETLIAQGTSELDKQAIAELERASAADPDYALAWRLLATAYGRQGNTGMSKLALAEEAALGNRMKEAEALAKQAMEALPEGSPPYLRASDLSDLVKRQIEKKEDAGLPVFE